jgi:hypothetical protein
MRWRVLAFISLGVNVVLAIGWAVAVHRHADRSAARDLAIAPGTNDLHPKPIVRRLLFTWGEVESPDYATYVSNLRGIRCPEQTIRDIIIADVNSLYARRLATEVVTADQQWWRSEPDPNLVAVAEAKLRDLEQERRALLEKLLGPSWEAGDLVRLPRPSRPVIALDGEVLGTLSLETKQAVQDLHTRLQARLENYAAAQARLGQNPDPVEMARMREQTRYELARVLSPLQMEEYLLRYAPNADALREEFGQLRFFSPTPDEFRAVFRATDAFDQRLDLLPESNDANTLLARKSLLEQRESALKLALGTKRYQDYVMLHDAPFREAVAAAQQAGTPDAARTLYQINLAAAAEQNRIQGDTNLTAAQKNIQLKQLDVEQSMANTLATGGELPPEPPPAPPPRRTYTIRAGDNAAVVGMIYGVPESAIRAANPDVNFNSLRPGDAINIPRAALAPVTAPRITPGMRTSP